MADKHFETAALDKLRELRSSGRHDVFLEVDGGVNTDTIGRCAAAGAHSHIVGSAIFEAPARMPRSIAELERLAQSFFKDAVTTMVQIVLIRPAATDYDEQGRILGTLDIPLSEQGSRDVERIIEEVRPLGITAIYCGPCQSACQTARRLPTRSM